MQQQLRGSSTHGVGLALHPARLSVGARPRRTHYNSKQPRIQATGSQGAAAPAAPAAPAATSVQDAQPTSSQQQQWRLYACRMPLVGLEGVAEALKGTPVARLLQLHTYLLLEGPDQAGVWYIDFLPLNPTAPGTALLLLTGGRAPGEVRFRRLSVQHVKVSDSVRLLGTVDTEDPLLTVQVYNRNYNKDLHLLLNNCMHYTNGLCKLLLTDGTQQY